MEFATRQFSLGWLMLVANRSYIILTRHCTSIIGKHEGLIQGDLEQRELASGFPAPVCSRNGGGRAFAWALSRRRTVLMPLLENRQLRKRPLGTRRVKPIESGLKVR